MSVKLHLRADAVPLVADGTSIPYFTDASDYHRSFIQLTGANQGKYFREAVAGRPGILFDGSNTWYAGQGRVSDYVGASGFSVMGVVKMFPESSAGSVFLNDAVLAFTGGFFSINMSTTPELIGYVYDGANKSRTRTIVSGDIVVFHFYLSGGNMYLSVNGGAYSSPVASGIPSDLTGTPELGRDYSATNYARMFLNQLLFESELPTNYADKYAALVREFRPTSSGAYREAQDVGSRILRSRRSAKNTRSIVVPYWYGLDVAMGSRVWLQIPQNHAAGSGLKARVWDLLRACVFSKTVDLNADRVILGIKDSLRINLWFGPESVSNPLTGSGVPLLLSGQTMTHTRAGTAVVVTPTNVGVQLPLDQEGYDSRGLLCEGPSTNLFLNPCFADGFNGWTTTGAGTASLDTSVRFFESGITPQSVSLLSDNPLVSGKTIKQTVAALANDVLALSMLNLDDNAVALAIAIQRSIDNWWWNGAAWQSGFTNFFAVTASSALRQMLAVFNVGTNNTNITVDVRNVVAAAKTSHLFHMQIEKQPWASSPIVGYNSSTQYARVGTSLLFTNNSSAPCFNPLHGTCVLEFDPNWNSSDVSGKTFCGYRILHDGNNEWKLTYNGTLGRYEVLMKSAGNSVTGYVAATVTRGTRQRVTIRWIGTQGELGLSPYTVDIFANAVKGTGVTNTALPTQAASCNMEVGSGGGVWLEGCLTRLLLTPDVLTDDRIQQGVD